MLGYLLRHRCRVPVKGLEKGVTVVASGFSHHCALMSTGAVLCWGYNDHGELGNGTTTATLQPTVATGLEKGVKAISASRYQTCALTSAGAVLCWGFNLNKVPTAIPGLPAHLIAIAAGTANTCAVTAEGAVWCWGASLAAPQAVSGLPERCYRHQYSGRTGMRSYPGGFGIVLGSRYANRPKNGSWP